MEPGKQPEWILHIISNTHWDREWYFSFERFRWRLVKLMNRLIHLLESQPNDQPFLMDGQFIPIQDYLEIHPENRLRIKRLVETGRLQIGPWYTQPLETIASGEAMIRNLSFGIQSSLNMGGVTRIGYMIDEFGHVNQLPQICKGFGLDDLVIWRGVPKGMQSLFEWEGCDGTSINVFYSNSGYGEATALPDEVDDHFEMIDWTPQYRPGLTSRLKALLDLRIPKATTHHLMCLNGIDHSFAQENLPEVLEKAQGLVPGVKVIHSTLPGYIKAVKDAHQSMRNPVQKYAGELMDSNEWVLKDIHSFRCEQKALNREVEFLLEKWAEPFATLAWLAGNAYPREEIWKAWEYVLQNHSHDSLGCSSVDEVYRQVMGRYEWAAGLAGEIIEESLQFLCRQFGLLDTEMDLRLVVFNPLNWNRSEMVHATLDIPINLGMETFCLLDEELEIPYALVDEQETFHLRFNPQRGHSTRTPIRQVKICFYAEGIPGLGYKTYQIKAKKPANRISSRLVSAPGVMENNFIRLKINPNGTYDLVDKVTGVTFDHLGFFEDGGEAGDGYTHTQPAEDEIITSTGAAAEISLLRDDGCEAEYQVSLVMDLPERLDNDRNRRSEQSTACKVINRIRLGMHSRRVDIRTTIDNQANDHRLRVVFPTRLDSESSWAAMPFAVVERKIRMPDPAEYEGEKPRPTFPQHHFVDVNDSRYGLMVANLGLYEYEVMDNPERSIALTLLRCTDRIDSGSLGAMESMRMPMGQEIGVRTFEYSLIPHAGGLESAVREADAFSLPMCAVVPRRLELEHLPGYQFPKMEMPLSEQHGFVEIEPEDVVLTAVKQHQNQPAVIIRGLNRSSKIQHARVRLNFPGRNLTQVWQTNLAEDMIARIPIDSEGWIHIELPGWRLFSTAWFPE
jgi:alpha-mannosidase